MYIGSISTQPQQFPEASGDQLDGLFDFVGSLFSGGAVDKSAFIAKDAIAKSAGDAISKTAGSVIKSAASDAGTLLKTATKVASSAASKGVIADAAGKAVMAGQAAATIASRASSGIAPQASQLITNAAKLAPLALIVGAAMTKDPSKAALIDAVGVASGAITPTTQGAITGIRGLTSMDQAGFGTFQPDLVSPPVTSYAPAVSTLGPSDAYGSTLPALPTGGSIVAQIPGWMWIAAGAGVVLIALESMQGSREPVRRYASRRRSVSRSSSRGRR